MLFCLAFQDGPAEEPPETQKLARKLTGSDSLSFFQQEPALLLLKEQRPLKMALLQKHSSVTSVAKSNFKNEKIVREPFAIKSGGTK